MNKDNSLSFQERYDLHLSDKVIQQYMPKTHFQINAFTLVSKSQCAFRKSFLKQLQKRKNNTPSTNCDESVNADNDKPSQVDDLFDFPCQEGLIYDALQCCMCLQPPAFAMQCPKCRNLVCSQCQALNAYCQNCHKTCKESIKYTEVKDRLLKAVLDRLIIYKHQCSEDSKLIYLTQAEMVRHRQSEECPSKLYSCFCQEGSKACKYSLCELQSHLKEECQQVKIQCAFC